MKEKIAVIDYNEIQEKLCEKLVAKGIICEKLNLINSVYFKECLGGFDKIVLPFPSKREKLFSFDDTFDITEIFTDKQLIIGGLIDKQVKEKLTESGISYKDYFDDEAYVLKNAQITVQGVLRLLFENTKGYLPGKTAIVTGFGRIGKILAVSLKNMGIKVYAAVRSRLAAAEAESCGLDVLKISQLKSTVFYFDYIFNTVPYEIFTSRDVRHMNASSVYFEIASEPFGARKEYFEKENKNYIFASALPGKYYPEAVAENITDYIVNLNKERS